MNIYEYMNSKDVADYCKKIEHNFSPVEMAFLIYESKSHTIDEKHKAYEKIIANEPDTEIKERYHCSHYDSLHELLKQYMQVENKAIKLFLEQEENAVYYWEIFCEDKFKGFWESKTYYSSFEEALKNLKQELETKHEEEIR